jgi:hypothetical protein
MYRQFTDERGSTWEAWEVHPASIERRLRPDRRAVPRQERDRRRRHEVRPIIPLGMEDGWLAFHGAMDRLRLAPIPHGWIHLSEAELGLLIQRAERVLPTDID